MLRRIIKLAAHAGVLAFAQLAAVFGSQNLAHAHDVRVAGPFPGHVEGATVDAVADGRLVLAVGDRAHIWDPKARRWNPKQIGAPRHFHTATALADGRIVLVGGIASEGSRQAQENALGTTTVWKPQVDVWEQGLSLIAPRIAHAVVRIAPNDLLVIGGASSAQFGQAYGPLLASIELIGDKTTSKRRPLSVPRAYHTAQLLTDGRVMVAGGLDDQGKALASVEFYDVAKDTWSDGPSLRIARSRHTMTALPDGSVLVVGGEDVDGTTVAIAELYQASNNGWVPMGSLAEARTDHQATRLSTGDVLVSGGLRSIYTTNLKTRSGYPAHSLELWSAATRTWHAAGELPLNARELRAVLSADDVVLLFGADGYGSAAFAWLPDEVEDLAVPEPIGGVLTPLRDGRYLLTGGLRRQDASASASLYDSKTNRWSAARAMRFARTNHRAVQLRDGRVLVYGGEIHGVPVERDIVIDGQKTGGKEKLKFPAEIWDPNTDTWTPSQSLKYVSGSWQEPAVLADGRVVLGVVQNESRYETAVHLFNIWNADDDSLSGLTQVPRTRADGIALFYSDGHLLYAGGNDQMRVRMDPRCQGGFDDETTKSAGMQIDSTTDPCTETVEPARDGKRLDWWDPLKRTWRELRPAELSLNGLQMRPLSDGGLLAWHMENGVRMSYAQAERPSDSSARKLFVWQPTWGWRNLPYPEGYDGREYLDPLPLDEGDLLLRAGTRSWVWEQATKEWQAIEHDAPNDSHYGTFVESDGRVIAFRVRRSATVSFAPIETVRLNRVASRWEPIANSYVPRPNPAAVALGDGSVLIAGGDVKIAQVWMSDKDAWRFTGFLSTALHKPRGLLLRNGRVMIAGWSVTDETKFLCEVWNPDTERFSACGVFSGTQGDNRHATVLRYLDNERVLLVYGQQQAFLWTDSANAGADGGEWMATKLQLPQSPSVPPADEIGTPYLNALAGVWNPAKNSWDDGADVLFANSLNMPAHRDSEGLVSVLSGWSRLLIWDPSSKTLTGHYLSSPHEDQYASGIALPDGCIAAWPNNYDSRYTRMLTTFVANPQTKKWLSSSVALNVPTDAASVMVNADTLLLAGRSRGASMGAGWLRLRASCEAVEPFDATDALYLPVSGTLLAGALPPPELGSSSPLTPKAQLGWLASWRAQWSTHVGALLEHLQAKLVFGVLLVFFALRFFMNRWGAYHVDADDAEVSGNILGRKIDAVVIVVALPLLAVALGVPHATTQVIASILLAMFAALSARRLWGSMDEPRDKLIYAVPMLLTALLATLVIGTYVSNTVFRLLSTD